MNAHQTPPHAMVPLAASPALASFAECLRVDASTLTSAAFWELMSRDPRPKLLVAGKLPDVDFVSRFGRRTAAGGADFDGLTAVDAATPYRLVNPPPPSTDGGVGGIFGELSAAYPLPLALADAYDLCPVISIGRNGTGQTDLARHYHSNTAMLLLQGEKIWALRPPSDGECAANRGDCTDPFDVCGYYARA
eukprot:6219220-Prymnesium_polylepis.1